jgi:CRISPR/Cas system CSM-associated protein Csm3 (group 7 of RAMP superfamily)
MPDARFVCLKVTFKMEGSFHYGGGKGAGMNTSLILLDGNANAYLSGSAVKGKLRHYVEMFCGAEEALTLFGEPGNAQGTLTFSNFTANPISGVQDTELRTGSAIDRYRRTAKDESLFTIESARVHTLTGTISGNITDEQEKILKGSLDFITSIGGGTSRGLGWVKVNVKEIPISEDVLKKESGRYKVTISPESPLFVGKHTSQNNFRDTLEYIPGETFRAALAKAITGEFGQTDVLGLSPDELKIGAFRPTGAIPSPLTARQCKYDNEHPVIDTLAYLLRKESTPLSCPVCKGRIDHAPDWIDAEHYSALDFGAYKQITTHSEIDRYRGIVKDGRLFSRRHISPDGVQFVGYIDAKGSLPHYKSLQIGALQSVGYGKVSVQYVPEQFGDTHETIRKRIEDFNMLIPGRNGYYIPVLVLSNALLPQDFTKWDDLFSGFKLDRTIAKTRRWRGVYTGKHAGKAPEGKQHYYYRLQLQAGSVFVLTAPELDDDLLKRLTELACNGIELAQGTYAEISIANNFHSYQGGLDG